MKELSEKYNIDLQEELIKKSNGDIVEYTSVLYIEAGTFSKSKIQCTIHAKHIENLRNSCKMSCELFFSIPFTANDEPRLVKKVEINYSKKSFLADMVLNLKNIFNEYVDLMLEQFYNEDYIVYYKDYKTETVSIKSLPVTSLPLTEDAGAITLRLPIKQFIKIYSQVIDKDDFLNDLLIKN